MKILLLLLFVYVFSHYTLISKNNQIIFKLNKYECEPINYNNEMYIKYIINDAINIDNPSFPDLPIIRKPLLGSDIRYFFISINETSIKTNKIIPIKKQNKRCGNVNIDTYEFNEIYKKNKNYPNDIVNIRKINKEKYVNQYVLEINPFIYNPKKGTLKIINNFVIELTDNVKSFTVTKSDFQLYQTEFLNFNNYKFNFFEETSAIIVADRFHESGKKLLEHKIAMNRKNVNLIKLSEINNIKTYITEEYYKNNLKYVTFIANQKDLPLIYARDINSFSDSVYGIIENLNNVFISRITGKTKIDIDAQINKIIEYEKSRINNLNFLGMASNDGNPNDCFHMNRLHNMIKESSMNRDQYKFNIMCDNNATKHDVIKHINNGINYINYLGHGSGTSWITSNYNTTDNKYLTNVANPIVIDISCKNGDIYLDQCLAESLMISKLYRTGTLSMYSSIPLADWFPPLYLQYYSWHMLQYSKDPISLGQMMYSGTLMSCVMFPKDCNMMSKGFMLYGDSSMEIHKL